MKVKTTHTTTYLYSDPVSVCHTEVHLAPRECPHQRLLSHALTIAPEPSFRTSRQDYFGNEITIFSIQEPHETLHITAESEIELQPEEPPAGALTPPWEEVLDEMRGGKTDEIFRAAEFTFPSPFVKPGADCEAYGRQSFPPGRPVLEAGLDLCHRIYSDFRYDPRATTIATPVEEVLMKRSGVCQDFAHLMISCARSLGLPARYISGYLRSDAKTLGGEASHAWCALFCPGFGWLEFDPTNDVMPAGNHVTIAHGRDYSDVAPVVGVALGGGEQLIHVSVSVLPPAGV
ncbi:MAG: transglutaminase family protein [Acidobacteriota bacterium]